VRYLAKAKIKAGKARPLLSAVDSETLGKGSIAGDEYIYNMTEARVNEGGIATWVETCFCDPPLTEERPYWEEYFELLNVKDAHSRRNCRHENGTENWACCDCDCTQKLEEKLRRFRQIVSEGAPFEVDHRPSLNGLRRHPKLQISISNAQSSSKPQNPK
jgi:hypothetical protein